jgi:glycine cleavage system aminomethyltransferase T
MASRLRVTVHDEPGWNYGLWRSAFHGITEARGASYMVYNQRLGPVSYGEDREAEYWALRRAVVMTDVSPEKSIEISGPDAERLMDRAMPRPMTEFNPGRALYGPICRPDGGLLCDGVLVRPAADRFWYVSGSADTEGWLLALSIGLDAEVSDPDVSVLAVQGPKSLDVLAAACDDGAPDLFTYFAVARVVMGGQDVLVTRTGWTGELGFEIYLPRAGHDGPALWRHIEAAGAPHGLVVAGLDAMDIRRIEAGILLYGADMDGSINPYQAGLGSFIDMTKPDFIGKAALEGADRTLLVRGLLCADDEPVAGGVLLDGRVEVGRVTAAAYSPYLQSGTAIVRLQRDVALDSKGLVVETRKGGLTPARLATLPLYDAEHRIVRGLDPGVP